MDPLTIGIALASVAGISGLIVVVMKVGLGSETNFAEKIEKQRQMLEESKKQKPKEKKKKEKKVKKESEGVSGSEIEIVDGSGDELQHVHVEYEPDPVIITEETIPRKKKVERVKSILKNKDEHPPVRASAPAETHFTQPPKDDLEIAHDKKAKKDKKKDKKKAEKVEPVDTAPVPVVEEQVFVEEMIVTEAAMVSSAAPTYTAPAPEVTEPVKSRRNKKSHAEEWTLSKLLDKVQAASLTYDDIQVLVDALLARQTSGDSWTTKGAKADPLIVLKKQKEDLTQALETEKASAESGRSKIKELQVKIQTKEREHQSHEQKYVAERTAMKATVEKLKRDVQVAQQARYEDSQKLQQSQTHIQQLTEQNSALKTNLPEANDMSALKNQLTSLQQAIAGLETERDGLTKRNRALESGRNDLSQQLNEARQRLENSERQQSHVSDVEKNLHNLQDQLKSQQMDAERQAGEQQRVIVEKDQQVQALRTELEKLQTELAAVQSTQINGGLSNGGHPANDDNTQQLGEQIQKLESEIQERDVKLDNYSKQLATMKSKDEELLSLREELKTATQLGSQHTELSAKNAELTTQRDELSSKNSELTTKHAELSAKSAELTTRHGELSVKNAELTEKHAELSATRDKLTAELAERSTQLTTSQSELKELNKKLESLQAERENSTGQLDEIKKLTSLLESTNAEKSKLTDKNNDLRRKNWALSEELSQTETKLNLSVQQYNELSSQIEGLMMEKSELVKRLSELENELSQKDVEINTLQKSANKPQLVVDESKLKTLEQLNRTLQSQLDRAHSDKQSLSSRLKEAESQAHNEDESPVKYRDALKQVDSMLVNLTSQIQTELSNYTETLSNKDKEIVEVKKASEFKEKELSSQVNKLQVKVDGLQADNQSAVSEKESLNKKLADSQLQIRQLGQQLAAQMAASGDSVDNGTCV